MEFYIIVGLVAAAALTFLCAGLAARHHRHKLQEELAGWRRGRRYWGIRIVAGKGKSGCRVARDMQRRILPIGNAPPLPLPRCGRSSCRCSYRPYPERRKDQRRHSGIRRDTIRFTPVERERREPHDRRKSDRIWEEVKH